MSPTVGRQDLCEVRQYTKCYGGDVGETRMRTTSLPAELELSEERRGKVRFRSESSICALKEALGMLKTELESSPEEKKMHTLSNWRWWEKTIQSHQNGGEEEDSEEEEYDEDYDGEESDESGISVDDEFLFSAGVDETDKTRGMRVQDLIDQDQEHSTDALSTTDEMVKNKVVQHIIFSVAKRAKFKSLRFADTLGEDLAHIKFFEDDVPVIPLSAYKDLKGIDPNDFKSHPHYTKTTFFIPRPLPSPNTSLLPMFTLPPVSPLHEDPSLSVRLESVAQDGPSVDGTVRVTNLHPEKTVTARWTTDGWKSHQEAEGHFVAGSAHDGVTELFTFHICPENIPVGGHLEFCIRSEQDGREFWDNNSGRNFVLRALPEQRQTSFHIEDYL